MLVGSPPCGLPCPLRLLNGADGAPRDYRTDLRACVCQGELRIPTPGRSCQDALRRVDELLKSGHVHVVEVDIRGYFDAIPHGRLMAEVEKHIADGRVLGLIEAFLKAGVMGEMDQWEVENGTPQGGVISPLLANIYLNPLDWKLAQAGLE